MSDGRGGRRGAAPPRGAHPRPPSPLHSTALVSSLRALLDDYVVVRDAAGGVVAADVVDVGDASVRYRLL